MSIHYLSCQGGPRADPIKSKPGHIAPNLCFCIWCDLQVTYCVLMHTGHHMSMHYFSCPHGPGADPKKVYRNTLHRTCVFASAATYGSCSRFYCVPGMKCRRTNFHARVGPPGIT
jgi:hypothetical protein